jgi:peptidoglycan/xylan/chitin deacetylase (PgdA/CDA1 family)
MVTSLILIAPEYGVTNGQSVLYYHRVTPEDMKQFKWQMKILARITNPVQLTDNEGAGNKPKVSITFDDGISDTIALIMPVMKDLSIPFTVFVPTGLIGSKPTFYSKITLENQRDIVLSEKEIRSYRNEPLVVKQKI